MGIPVVIVTSGGIAVTESTSSFGAPMTEATNGFGIPVTFVDSGGLAVVGISAAPSTPTGDGSMDFSIATGDNTGLLALLEDI